jgi:serine protease Do
MGVGTAARAQSFDFNELHRSIQPYTVILDIQVEFSFGTQTNEHEQRLLGTIVSEDGLVVFDGGLLQEENPLVPSFGFSFRATPKRIDVTTLDEKKYSAEYIGVDRFTRLGFARIVNGTRTFVPVKFVAAEKFEIGDWLATYALLPEYVDPPLTADIGMISSIVSAPEEFTLTVGFNSLEFASVLYDKKLRPVGLLGEMSDPTNSGADQGGFGDSFDRGQFPLLGVITADRLDKLIANPPQRGRTDRSWLGITMQGLTEDLADFLRIDNPGGIIVNEVVPGSPADLGGVSIGDVIYAINDQRVTVDRDEELAIFQRMVSALAPGTSVELGVYRPSPDGLDSLRLVAVLSAAPLAASDAEEFEFEPFEFTVRDLVFSDFLNYNIEQSSLEGVVVAELKPGGLAAIGGLRPGDVIQRVNDRDVSSVAEFELYFDELEAERPTEVILFLWRFGQTLFVNVKTDWS